MAADGLDDVTGVSVALTWLKDAPSTRSPSTDAKARALRSYFDRTWITESFCFRYCLTTTAWDQKQRTSRKGGTIVSTHISVCHIRLFVSFWIAFRSVNTVSSAVEYSLPLVGHGNLETSPTFSWTSSTDQPRSSMGSISTQI